MSKIEQNGKTSLRRPKLLIKEVKCLMKKKKTLISLYAHIFIFSYSGICLHHALCNYMTCL